MENKGKFSIPKPCHEDWNTMTQEEKGRFCSVCSKTVFDFTLSSNEQIQEHLDKKKGQRVCGRFRDDQLKPRHIFTVPHSVIYQNRSFHKAFLLALFVVMGTSLFSCKNHSGQTVGEIAVENDLLNQQNDTVAVAYEVGEAVPDPSKPGKALPPPPKPKIDEVKFVKPVPPEEIDIEIPNVTVGIIMPDRPPAEVREPSAPKEIKGNN